jgi:phytoene dehydrogenase-like protein
MIIIGAGMGGLAVGIYGQLNGYKTRIFEMHNIPGGQCTAWKRHGYTFDVCIHHLFGCSPATRINQLWQELGAMPRELAYTTECVSVASPDGRLFHDYYDPDRLEAHLLDLSPSDAPLIKEYVNAIRVFARKDIWGALMFGSGGEKLKSLWSILPAYRSFRYNMQQYAARFSDPFLRQAFPLLVYSLPDAPFFLHLARKANGFNRDVAWPVGGAAQLARSIETRYLALGGEVHYRQRVEKIITRNRKAVGVRLEDGTEDYADIVISNADGRKTILNMLDGMYMDKRIREYCGEPLDETNWAAHVFLGVSRDLSREPSALIMLLDRPVQIAGHSHKSLEMQLYGFDKTLAPEGKGVIKVELFSTYSYWRELYNNKAAYDEEKARTAGLVIDLLEKRFAGIKEQVEVIDVPTLVTWERFMGGTHGFVNMPNKKMNLFTGFVNQALDSRLPGLDNFYLVGAWATSLGALFANAQSGKTVVKDICQRDGKRFSVSG